MPRTVEMSKRKVEKEKSRPLFSANSPLPYCKTTHRAPPKPPLFGAQMANSTENDSCTLSNKLRVQALLLKSCPDVFFNLGWEGWENFSLKNTHPPLSPTTENVMTRRWKCTCLGNLLRGTLIGWTGTKEKHLIGPRPCPTITNFGRCHYCPGTRTPKYLFMQKANAFISGLFSLINVITTPLP